MTRTTPMVKTRPPHTAMHHEQMRKAFGGSVSNMSPSPLGGCFSKQPLETDDQSPASMTIFVGDRATLRQRHSDEACLGEMMTASEGLCKSEAAHNDEAGSINP